MSDTGRPGPERPTGPPTPPPVSNWQAQQPPAPTAGPFFTRPTEQGAARPADQAAEPAAAGQTTSDAPGRPRWLLPVIIGVVVLVVAAIVVGILASRGGDDDVAPPAAASTVQLPSPTPTVEPVARPATTTFAGALPTTVLQYALATSEADPQWQAAGAIEAYTETFTDGGSGTVTVRSGQWETADEATAFAASLVAALPTAPAPDPSASPTDGATLPQTGDVTAGGAAAGTYTIVDAGDGTGVAVWTNGTAVFQVTAPVADVVDVYTAFPL